MRSLRRTIFFNGKPFTLPLSLASLTSTPSTSKRRHDRPSPSRSFTRAHRPSRWSEKLTRNRHRKRLARLLDRIGYAGTIRQIGRSGV
jgi:hypothetical protein